MEINNSEIENSNGKSKKNKFSYSFLFLGKKGPKFYLYGKGIEEKPSNHKTFATTVTFEGTKLWRRSLIKIN